MQDGGMLSFNFNCTTNNMMKVEASNVRNVKIRLSYKHNEFGDNVRPMILMRILDEFVQLRRLLK